MGKTTTKKYIKNFRRLVQLEREEEMRAHELEIRRLSGKERQEKGRALLSLRGRDAGPGLGGRRLVKFLTHPGEKLPETEIKVGDLVLVSQGNPLRGENPVGTVIEQTPFSVTVSFDDYPPPFLLKARNYRLRLDLYVNDITYQRMLAALDRWEGAEGRLVHLRRVLLAQRKPVFKLPEEEISFFTPNLNPSQREAVRRALGAQDLMLIHGPPGTGKTMTIIELIRQLIAQGEKVLATADSNTAVDNMVERLADQGVKVVRVGHPARVSPLLRQHTLDYLLEDNPWYQSAQNLREKAMSVREKQQQLTHPGSRWRRGLSNRKIRLLARRGQGSRGIPPQRIREMARWLKLQEENDETFAVINRLEAKAVQEILKYAQVICATNSTAGSDILSGWSFDAVIIDEATQATEPSCLIPLALGKRFFLAGDHKQLPPTVLSQEAVERGLNKTLFERLLEEYGDEIKQVLRIQYRMHRDIMAFPNQEFYAGMLAAHPSIAGHTLADLIPEDKVAPDLPAALAQALDPRLPLAFIDIKGEEEQRPGSPSRENRREAEIISLLARSFLDLGLVPIDIAVISPYSDQVRLIKENLSEYEGLEVKTVDGFQGREKEVILISFVRSNAEGELGFLTDLRRLNVAITRARRKLVMVGNSTALGTNPTFARLLDWCREKEGFFFFP